jgi:hypothetical protein
MKNILGDIITGWTTYVLHPVLFYPNVLTFLDFFPVAKGNIVGMIRQMTTAF